MITMIRQHLSSNAIFGLHCWSIILSKEKKIFTKILMNFSTTTTTTDNNNSPNRFQPTEYIQATIASKQEEKK
ncbi:hypothetical protein DERF_001255 [Dermatophagoides farinae]|uniref:Uncharacterized protein n=1 Tax=Dermatophagoides farinae TaxID=6954 RepID=A0A922I946_DERFA|nr:hypothetical protein DERF_001255 [Dermatophagoides farinae]